MSGEKVAVVTGANRGLGLAVVQALCERGVPVVYLTSRDEARGRSAAAALAARGLRARTHQLDVTDAASVRRLADHLRREHDGFDYLVNNAAIMDYEDPYPSYEAAERNIDTNYRSLLTVEKYLFPLLREGARVVNVSSACGHLSNLRASAWLEVLGAPDLTRARLDEFVAWYLRSVREGSFRREDFADAGRHAAHRVSKIAVTALSIIQAREYAARRISVNALYPGHLATAMAAGTGTRPPAAAAAAVARLLLDAPAHLSGAFVWDDGRLVDFYDYNTDYYYKHQDLK